MREGRRPDPDALIAALREEERRRTHGKLRVYLGFAPGVGKTYAMLEAAQRQRKEGVDVVVGYVDTHGRKETDLLLEGLERIPVREIDYRGITLKEMDLDAILARRPKLVLVDELAHTNAPGSRHPKRYQDVEEILAAGIDVYTTVNVQHLESMRETVAKITGVLVSEMFPDSVFDAADEIKVVDISPQELLQRLRDGKVYIPEQAARAMRSFFQSGNLIALRQITLRRVAERLDEQMRDYMESLAIPGPWPARERLLICVDPREQHGERLVRAGRRLADELYAEWETVLVGAPEAERASPQVRAQASAAIRLADRLGATVNTTPLPAEGRAIIEYARANNITRIIVAWPVGPRWREVLRPHLATEVIRLSGPIDVMVVTDEAATPGTIEKVLPRGVNYGGYLWGTLAVALASVLGELARPHVNVTALAMVFIMAVVLVASAKGLGPALFTSTLSVLAYDYFFIPPRFTLSISDPQNYLTFAALYLTGVVISLLISTTRHRAETARRQSIRTATLYSMSRDLAVAPDLSSVLASVIGHIQSSFDAYAIVLMPEHGRLRVASASQDLSIEDDEVAVADWVFKHGRTGGLGTDTLPGAKLTYLPMRQGDRVIGVVGVVPKPGQGARTPADERLLEGLVSLASLAVQRVESEGKPPPSEL
ncbi:MAG TPA: DUF4118 domain-containing protein [Thermoplasmata archaeon]|jgi:two-component system sensor histidine kinase KdpD